jgi:hypothetical protein
MSRRTITRRGSPLDHVRREFWILEFQVNMCSMCTISSVLVYIDAVLRVIGEMD